MNGKARFWSRWGEAGHRNWLVRKVESLASTSATTMSTFESLPVELISDILGETDIKSLIGASSFHTVWRCSGYLNTAPRRNSCVWLISQITRNHFGSCTQSMAPSSPTQATPWAVRDRPRESQPPHDCSKIQLDRDHEQSASRIFVV